MKLINKQKKRNFKSFFISFIVSFLLTQLIVYLIGETFISGFLVGAFFMFLYLLLAGFFDYINELKSKI